MSDVILKAEDLKKYFKIKGRKVVKAVDGVSIEVERGKTLGLVGESGCGKSTLGRTLIRIYEPTEGKITLNGKDISGKSTKRFRQDLARSIQMIFQDPYACLSPRMTVSQLISEGWGLNHAIHMSAEEKRDRVIELLETVGLNEEHASRFPHEFSGGQRQRVALGRAIVRNAKLFLMDEPLSNLDAKLRVQMRSEIIKLHERIGATTIYVTHDQTEAMTMADRIVVMKDGYVQQIGTPREIYHNPANMFVAGFLGAPATNFITGTYSNKQFILENMKIDLPDMFVSKLSSYEGKQIILGIRPEDLYGEGIVTDTYPSACFDFDVDIAELLGHEYILHGTLFNQPMRAKVASRLNPSAHSTLSLTMDLSKIHFFDPETELRID